MKIRNFLVHVYALSLLLYAIPSHSQKSDTYTNFYSNKVVNKFAKTDEFNRQFKVTKEFSNGTLIFDESQNIKADQLFKSFNLSEKVSFQVSHESTSRLDKTTKTRKYDQYYQGVKVSGGGVSFYLKRSKEKESVLSVTPYIFEDINVSTKPKIQDVDILKILKPAEGNFTKELLIDYHYNNDYTLVYFISYSKEGEPYVAWIDASNGKVYENIDVHCHLNGTTTTYGTQALVDNTVAGVTSLESPTREIRVYEGLNPSYPLVVSQWTQSLVPTTTNTTSWGTDATAHSLQTLHAATEVIPIFDSQAGIDFDTVHIAANSVANAFAVGGSVSGNAYITAGIYGSAPLSLYDVVGHELGHVYIWSFLQYSSLGNRSLHEGFSDVFGTYVESYVQSGGVDWVVGDDESAVSNWLGRDLANPVCLDNIGGGAHTRGLIAGHWFHTISVGNSGLDIMAFGMPTAIALIKDAFALIPSNSDYAEFRDATLTVAQQNWGYCSEEYNSIVNAWNKVCVTTEECDLCPSGKNMLISSNTTISGSIQVGGNIIVQPGVQLTVTGTIEFLQGKALVVRQGAKLDLNGGHLTKCITEPDWRGVIVEGFSNQSQPDAFDPPAIGQAGIVLVRNNALIDWARTAISTNYWGSWTNSKWGGLVHVENSEFYNNRRVAEFMKYDFTNKSLFHNVTMDGSSTISGTTVGVTIWDTDGIKFNQCRFYNMESQGILTYDSGAAIVDGNDFMYNNKGISNRATYPFGAYLVVGENGSDPNYFYDNVYHIESLATNKLSGLNIKNNEFFDGIVSAYIIGPSKYFFDYNSSAEVLVGVYTNQAGSLNNNQHNYVRFNGFNTSYGVYAYARNRELQILCNDYISTYDNVVNGTSSNVGEIRLFQGNPFSPAGNCFTNPVNSGDIRTFNTTNTFNYFHSNSPNCQVPVTPGNYNPLASNYTGCKEGPVKPPKDDEWEYVLEKIKILEDKGDTKSKEYYKFLQRRDELLLYYLEEAIANNDSELAISYLEQANTPHSKMMKFGILMNDGKYESAAAELSKFNTEENEMSEFVEIQNINLAYLTDINGFKLSDAQKSFLVEVSESEMGVKAYARSLLGLLTGIEYNDDLHLEEHDDKKNSLLTNGGNKKDLLVSVAPNPTEDKVIINMTSLKNHKNLQLDIIDVNGKIKYSSSINSKRSIEVNLEEYPEGFYFIRILGSDKNVLYTEKIIKL